MADDSITSSSEHDDHVSLRDNKDDNKFATKKLALPISKQSDIVGKHTLPEDENDDGTVALKGPLVADEEGVILSKRVRPDDEGDKDSSTSTTKLNKHDRDEKGAEGDSGAQLSNTEQVALHYNTRRQLGTEDRLRTKITGLRLFNNWVKSVLITEHTFARCKVLDLGCGKGGDLLKWSIANIGEYVGMDIAEVSVAQARERYMAMSYAKFPARFYAQDCYGEPLEKTIKPADYKADVISAQFCLHYAFETETKAHQMMSNVSSHLAKGGTFVCTIPNANWLVKQLRASESTSFGNDVYTVKFATSDPPTLYGCAYKFTLDEAVEECTEYLVNLPSFIELAKSYGLELMYVQRFHELFNAKIDDPKFLGLFRKMRVIDDVRQEISDDEWEAQLAGQQAGELPVLQQAGQRAEQLPVLQQAGQRAEQLLVLQQAGQRAEQLPALQQAGQQAEQLPVLQQAGQQAEQLPVLQQAGQQAEQLPVLQQAGQQLEVPVGQLVLQQVEPPVGEQAGPPVGVSQRRNQGTL
ncbi:mRNA cap guanine-N7 methyltransferase [Kickxella alabastrina]|uniref:mRNA cap guanine-N7 methyltransferase n=1 Tax=Kickxella alabastrina TaxID=61397 RepID=A0ACC1IUR3_9FUNG|nr:mRNA cap guanine-N7 methyltransferase [Kickxella alabastrina]